MPLSSETSRNSPDIKVRVVVQVVTPHCEIGSHTLFINIMNKCVEVKLMSHTETLQNTFDFSKGKGKSLLRSLFYKLMRVYSASHIKVHRMNGHKSHNWKSKSYFQHVEYNLENQIYLTQYQVGDLQLQC